MDECVSVVKGRPCVWGVGVGWGLCIFMIQNALKPTSFPSSIIMSVRLCVCVFVCLCVCVCLCFCVSVRLCICVPA